ncbi:MAG TPA: class I SAM-dependent methyltransferase [Nitrospiria bacterium]|nr:class I SAM-dependent methyltransferase [Nitrospiria bacterium]
MQPIKPTQPDWNEMAKTFDTWLPYIQPVADRLIDALDLKPGLKVLDVACGTGEPGLTIARRWKGRVEVLGIDAAEGMIGVCSRKVTEERLDGINYRAMKAEEITFPDGSYDRVISRFGVMLFDDPLKGLREMFRVLRHGGRMAFSVWSEFDKVQAASIPFRLLSKQFPENDRPPEPKMATLGAPGKLEALLKDAGIPGYRIEPLRLTYTFDDPEDLWNLVTQSGFSKEHYEKLSENGREAWHHALLRELEQYNKNGKTTLTNEALIVDASKK